MICVVFLVCLSIFGSHSLPTTTITTSDEIKTSAADLLSSLDNYMTWATRVSETQQLSSELMDDLEVTGEFAHDSLAEGLAALSSTLEVAESSSDSDFGELTKNGLISELIEANTSIEELIGLTVSEPIDREGVRLSIALRMFRQLVIRLQAMQTKLKLICDENKELDVESLTDLIKQIWGQVSVLEIVYDGIVTAFEMAEQMDAPDAADEIVNPESKPLNGRHKRQTNLSLGGGFSTNGRSLIYNRGRTTVSATPHFNNRFRFQGADASFSHSSGTGRTTFTGGASVNGQGRFTGARLGIRIKF